MGFEISRVQAKKSRTGRDLSSLVTEYVQSWYDAGEALSRHDERLLAGLIAADPTVVKNALLSYESSGHVAVGCVIVGPQDDDLSVWSLEKLYVRPAYRRHGAARCLVISAIELADQGGALAMQLVVHEERLAAIGLYRSLGFADLDGSIAHYLNMERAIP